MTLASRFTVFQTQKIMTINSSNLYKIFSMITFILIYICRNIITIIDIIITIIINIVINMALRLIIPVPVLTTRLARPQSKASQEITMKYLLEYILLLCSTNLILCQNWLSMICPYLLDGYIAVQWFNIERKQVKYNKNFLQQNHGIERENSLSFFFKFFI